MGDENKDGEGGEGGGTGGKPPGEWIPKARFDEVNNRGRDALAKVSALELQVQELRTNSEASQGWQVKAQEAQAKLDALTRQHSAYLDGVSVGLTSPKILEHAYREWEASPAEARKPFGETLSLWREKPEEAPELLRPHVVALGQGAGTAGKGAQPPKPPPANRGAGAPPPPNSRPKLAELPADEKARVRRAFFG